MPGCVWGVDTMRAKQLTVVCGMTFLTLGLLLTGEARRAQTPGALLCDLAGALFMTAAAFLGSSIVALGDGDDPDPQGALKRRSRGPTAGSSRVGRRWGTRVARLRDLLSRSQPWCQSVAILTTMILSTVGTVVLLKGWRMPGVMPGSLQAPAAAVLVALAFPLLVLERYFTSIWSRTLPDGAMLARLCRVPMITLLGLGVCCLLRWIAFPALATLLERGIAVIVALVGLELALRSLAAWYAPRAVSPEQSSYVDSTIAGLLRFQRPDLTKLSVTASRHFGLDFTRSWALTFLRGATLPFLLVLAVCCWLLTGVSALGLSERAVYESFGRPVAVLQPGLHVHLPWPLGVLRPLELGTVYEVPVVFAPDNGVAAEVENSTQPSAADVEGPAPPSADRLWDASHPSEASYLVASVSNQRQNFEVINIDLRVLYRIGLSDEAAREAVYHLASAQSIIQAAAGRMLARYFARYTLLDVLGQNREAFIRGFQQELQSRLAQLSTGIEIMGVVVEAIHPPPEAAPSYQGVQTAAIRSVVQIAQAHAEAVESINSAQDSATLMRNTALAAAAERVDLAQVELTVFDADRQAYRGGGPSFLLERRLQHFNKALAGVPFTLVDHRIERADAPILDLRPSGSASDSLEPASSER